MSHSSSNDDDWWVQIQLKMQSNNQNQRGEEDLPEIARTEEEQRHLFFLPNFTQVLRFDGGSGGYPGTAGMRMVLFDLEIWSRGLSNIRRPRRYECCWIYCTPFWHTICECNGITKLVVEEDSTSVVKQVTKEYCAKSDHFMKVRESVKATTDSLGSFWNYCIPKAENVGAD